jgi:hypothetical protein
MLRGPINETGANMNKLLLRVLLAVVAASGMTLAAAGGADPVIGTWQLDTTKSTFPTGPAVKSLGVATLVADLYATHRSGTACRPVVPGEL